jgi:hypothetical protein
LNKTERRIIILVLYDRALRSSGHAEDQMGAGVQLRASAIMFR